MQRHSTQSLKTVFEWMDNTVNDGMKDFDGVLALSGLLNYHVFKHKGTDCVYCGAKGKYFILERTPGPGRSKYNSWHFNLYAEKKDMDTGKIKLVMMTKDHIHPESKGGPNALENLQPMCSDCNSRKGSLSMDDFVKKMEFIATQDVEELDMSMFTDILSVVRREYKDLGNIKDNAIYFRTCTYPGLMFYYHKGDDRKLIRAVSKESRRIRHKLTGRWK